MPNLSVGWTKEFTYLQNIGTSFDKSIKLYTKDHWLMKLCSWFLFLVSFGLYKREYFQKEFATTVANMHFYPEEWSVLAVETSLAHEAEHTKQFRMFGLGIHPMVGLLPGLLIYLLFPLPIGFCYGRYWMEKNANVALWKDALRHLNWKANDVLHDAIVSAEDISGFSYLWAYPRSRALKEYEKSAQEVINEYEKEHQNV